MSDNAFTNAGAFAGGFVSVGASVAIGPGYGIGFYLMGYGRAKISPRNPWSGLVGFDQSASITAGMSIPIYANRQRA